MQIIKLRKKTLILTINILILVCISFFLKYSVYSQENESDEVNIEDTTFPYSPIPNKCMNNQLDENDGKYIIGEKLLEKLRNYFKNSFILEGEYLTEEHTGPEFEYVNREGIYKNTIDPEDSPAINKNLLKDNVRNYFCEKQYYLKPEYRVNSYIFCQNDQQPACIDDGSGFLPEDTIESAEGGQYEGYMVPVNNPIISSDYNYSESFRKGNFHRGVDYATNGDALATNHGIVYYAADTQGSSNYQYGIVAIIYHNVPDSKCKGHNDCPKDELFSIYAHLASLKVKQGDFVERGQPVGVIGTTGNSSGVHLHFEFRNSMPSANMLPAAMWATWDGGINCGNSCPHNINPHFILDDSIQVPPPGDFEDPTDDINYREYLNAVKYDPEYYIPFCEGVKPSAEYIGDTGEIIIPGGGADSLGCMFNIAAKTIDVPKEAIYAIAKQEVQLVCPLTWDSWLSGDRTPCSGDPNQVSFSSRNRSAADIYDVRGFTQFLSTTFNGIEKNAQSNGFDECIAKIGSIGGQANNIPQTGQETGTEYDPKALFPKKYSRHLVGQTICATAIKLRQDAGQGGKDWNRKILDNIATRYHGSCSGKWVIYCNNVWQYYNEAKGLPDIFKCKATLPEETSLLKRYKDNKKIS